MIALKEEYHDERCLTLLFPHERQNVNTLHGFRAAFGKQTDIRL